MTFGMSVKRTLLLTDKVKINCNHQLSVVIPFSSSISSVFSLVYIFPILASTKLNTSSILLLPSLLSHSHHVSLHLQYASPITNEKSSDKQNIDKRIGKLQNVLACGYTESARKLTKMVRLM